MEPRRLEQRTRVHSFQLLGVGAINFAVDRRGGMLASCFHSRSRGVLDGGEKDVMFGGTRLTKFMETVEETTKAIPTSAQDGSAPMVEKANGRVRKPEAASGDGEALSGLVQSGLAFLQNLAAVTQKGQTSPLVGRDEKTGQEYLKLRMPDPATMQQLMTLVGVVAEMKCPRLAPCGSWV